jgi:hypothetical protein
MSMQKANADFLAPDAFNVISKWGCGARNRVAAMESARPLRDPAVTTHKVDTQP